MTIRLVRGLASSLSESHPPYSKNGDRPGCVTLSENGSHLDLPPRHCGVGNYSYELVQSEQRKSENSFFVNAFDSSSLGEEQAIVLSYDLC
jgi:hypothetical protein